MLILPSVFVTKTMLDLDIICAVAIILVILGVYYIHSSTSRIHLVLSNFHHEVTEASDRTELVVIQRRLHAFSRKYCIFPPERSRAMKIDSYIASKLSTLC